MNNYKISIITPTYNRVEYLPLAIESVLNQTYTNFEYHIIDDGSTDNTKDVIQKYLEDNRVSYYYQKNQGQSAARNYGINKSTGDFICFLDSDNLWEPRKLELQVNIFKENPNIDITYGEGRLIDVNGNFLESKKVNRYSGYITEKILLNNFVSNNTVMCKINCFNQMGGFDESLRCAEDYDLWLRFSTRYSFFYQQEYYAKYRIWDDRLSANIDSVFKNNYIILKRFFEDYPDSVRSDLEKYIFCRFHTQYGRFFASNKKYSLAIKEYKKAMSYKPFSIMLWRALAKMLLLWK